MALIVFLRGLNTGGHRTFRPSILARQLSGYDVVNLGAAGTFVVRKPGSRTKFRAELLRKLPFKAEVVLCDGRDLIRLETENPFGGKPPRPDIVRFVSILSRAGGLRAVLPVTFPPEGEWLVRVIASKNRFVFGVYRSPHEDDRLSWPNRQAVRCAGNYTQLEHNSCRRADFEKSREERRPPRCTLALTEPPTVHKATTPLHSQPTAATCLSRWECRWRK